MLKNTILIKNYGFYNFFLEIRSKIDYYVFKDYFLTVKCKSVFYNASFLIVNIPIKYTQIYVIIITCSNIIRIINFIGVVNHIKIIIYKYY